MTKVIAICGKICCGKSYYASSLLKKEKAVILSCDELTSALFDNDLGDKHEEILDRIRKYLLKKAVDIISAGSNVILDWGFWTKEDRTKTKQYFLDKGIKYEMHFVDLDDATWERNVAERNKRVLDCQGGSDYYLDDGLKNKLLSIWQQPEKNEIDVYYKLERE